MGLVASQARLLMLYARKSDLEFVTQSICQQLQFMAGSMNNIAMQKANLANQSINANPNTQKSIDAQMAAINAKEMVVHNQEKYLEMLQKQYETQHTAVSTEIESVKKVIDKNIEMTFKYFA